MKISKEAAVVVLLIFKGENMSISLIGIAIGLPLTLTVRAVMGKEKFDEWIKSSEVLRYTNFRNIEEMKRVVLNSGYDISYIHGTPKTHLIKHKDSYFLWEIREGRITAVMSKYDNEQEVQRFIDRVENVVGRKVFSKNVGQDRKIIECKNEMEEKIQEHYPTVYSDLQLLLEILEQYNISVSYTTPYEVYCKETNYEMHFIRKTEN